MTAREIIAALILKGIKRKEIARALNVSEPMIYRVIHGQSTSRRIQVYIARLIDKDVDVVWPHDKIA